MNNTYILLMLVNTLTKAEKRYFHLCSNLQNGDKVYLTLFNLIDANTSPEQLYTRFCQIQDGKSFETAVKHLYRVLLECLVRLREKQDVQTRIFNYISKAGVLFEREIFDEAFIELDKAKKLAITYENDSLLLLIRRTELKYLSALDFKTISEKQLVNKQMKINEVLKYARTLNQHTQLYDILKHRLINKGYIRSDKQKEDLNDLVLSELHLIANNSYQGFEAQKLHLLFQATYYLNSGNYKSAIRYYQELINLFNDNQHLILNPPIYYLSAIQGILDSLCIAGLYHETPFFLSKLEELTQNEYSTEFILHLKTLIYIYKSNSLLQAGNFEQALELRDKQENELLKKVTSLGLESQLRLYLSFAVLGMYTKDYVQARKYMKKIFSLGKLFCAFPSYKTARLVNLLLQAELGNYDFFENEIISIKRNIRFEKQTYIT
ncbi:hypothetical protein, partial [Parabacteroides sp.]|uniref:hypothetical protein n=1 Tax=Parabacteroides sp. TaxID=1869337 RepID=UPI00257D0452